MEAAQDRIVTFGICPDGPETGYGYIQRGGSLGEGVFAVRRFAEKPPKMIAQTYIDDGDYFWNAGIFLYKPSVFLSEAQRLCPEVVRTTTAAFDAAQAIDFGTLLDPGLFAGCPSEAIDIAIMEKTEKAAVTPISVGWADIGSWSELWRHGAAHDTANHTRGDIVSLDTTGSLLWSDGPSISVIGMQGVIVVATGDHVLVLPKDRAQDVKKIVEHRKAKR